MAECSFSKFHDGYAGEQCEKCGAQIDRYGNTEDDFRFCSFPNCGCDGSRLCMAKNGASEYSVSRNVEGMWNCTSPRHVRARREFIADMMEADKSE